MIRGLLSVCVLGCLIASSVADEDDSDFEDGGSMVKFGDFYEKGKSSSGLCDDSALKGGWSYSRLRGSCNQYLHCADDRAFIQTCAAGTFYDGKECRHADEVVCPADPCLRKPPGFTYADGQSCYGFYQCIKGKSRYLTCHDGFYFNPYKQGCFPDPTCHRNNLVHPCAFGTTLPFPGRPNLFYLYDGRKTMTPMKCPKGTWYRPDICTCDWIIPGKVEKEGCKPMFHFKYNGNFLERYNRVQQMPTTGVTLFRRSVLFDHGGKIIIWAMNNMDFDGDFSLCFEFMVKTFNGEIALLSNDFEDAHFTYKLSFIPALGVVKGYFVLRDGSVATLDVMGVNPNQPHFVRIAKSGRKLHMRIDNSPPAVVKLHTGIATGKSPMVIGAANGCSNFVGYFDELKFFRCNPTHFFGDYDDELGHHRIGDDSDEDDDDDDFDDDRKK
ncbi:uncharacterized protein [Magallana gigas]|uniref:uncharacterized protein n=1 Tax=Magallana gigas TaxID=29159 RepID=UPI0033415993